MGHGEKPDVEGDGKTGEKMKPSLLIAMAIIGSTICLTGLHVSGTSDPMCRYRAEYNEVTGHYRVAELTTTRFGLADWEPCDHCIPDEIVFEYLMQSSGGSISYSDVPLTKQQALEIVEKLCKRETEEKRIKNGWKAVN